MYTLPGLVHTKPFEECTIDRTIDRAASDSLPTERYHSVPARKVSFRRSEKNLTQHCLSLFPLY